MRPSSHVAVRPERRPCLMKTPFVVRPGRASRNYRLPVICPRTQLHSSYGEAPPNKGDASLRQETKPWEAGMTPRMADPMHGAKPRRVLLSQANTTSAREALTILELRRHTPHVSDPSP